MSIPQSMGDALPQFTASGTRSTKYERILAVDVASLPESFRSLSQKEELVLQMVRHFNTQFVQLYPDRPPLMLAPKNEAGVPKFVCTTLRPTQLPIKDLHDYAAAARFVASYIKYEPLDDPLRAPAYLPSPYFTIQSRLGDAFDMSMVLASYLLGAGFDAYVVVGTAPKWLTLREEGGTRSEFVPPPDALDTKDVLRHAVSNSVAFGQLAGGTTAMPARSSAAVAEPPGAARYKLPPPPSIDSDYLRLAESKQQEKPSNQAADESEDEDDAARLMRGVTASLLEPAAARSRSSAKGQPPEAEDPLYGRRVHAWVLVRAGRREVKEHIFLEPSTGRIFPITTAPYLTVEAVWNHTNYYVNMQAQSLLPRQGSDAPPDSSLSVSGRLALVGTAGTASLSPRHGGSRSPRQGRSKSPRGRQGVLASTQGSTGGSRSPRAGVTRDAEADDAATTSGGIGSYDPYVAKRPPLRGELTHRSGLGAGHGVSRSPSPNRSQSPPTGSPITGGTGRTGTGRSGSSRPRSRARSGGLRGGGSATAWRAELRQAAGALRDRLADALERQDVGRSVSHLSYDVRLTDDWEVVMVPLPDAGLAHADADEPEDRDVGATQTQDAAAGVGAPTSNPGALGAVTGDVADGGTTLAGGKREDGGPQAAGDEGSGGEEAKGPGAGSAALAARFKAPLEKDGEHILDLPRSWVPRLVLDAEATRAATMASTLSAPGAASGGLAVEYHRSRLETWPPHAHAASGLIGRYTEYADDSRLIVVRMTETFARRKDSLFKRVRCSDGRQLLEEHFEKGRPGGLALLRSELGKRDEAYYYPGARVDGLLCRIYVAGEEEGAKGGKITELYGATPNHLCYRSIALVPITLAEHRHVKPTEAASAAAKTTTGGKAGSTTGPQSQASPPGAAAASTTSQTGAGLTIEIERDVEVRIRKMTEKYRRDPTTLANVPCLSKVMYAMAATGTAPLGGTITAYFHHAPGRITAASRRYDKLSGAMEQLTVDAAAPPARPFDIDIEFRRLVRMEKECHAAARAQAKASIEMVSKRAAEEAVPELERTVFEIAADRAAAGITVEDEEEKRAEENEREMDYLLPFLLAAKCADPNNPTEREARRADRDCRAAFKDRLLERVAIIQRRLDDENEKLLRRQQAFSRNRDHGEGAEEEFERYCADATFRIGILEQRLERQEALVTRKYAELEARLAADPRLAVIHNPQSTTQSQHKDHSSSPPRRMLASLF